MKLPRSTHVVTLLCCALLIVHVLGACAGGYSKKAEEAAPTSTGDDPSLYAMKREQSARAQIEALWAEIESERESGGMTEPISVAQIESMSASTIEEVRAACEPPIDLTSTCEDVCTLGRSICDNAESICRLADDLGDDEWAHGKCDSAKAACAEANQRCCDCS